MLKRRIIPCLDIKNGRVVKGVHFAGLRDAGDPVEAARAYDQQGADEICLLDITATTEGRATFVDIVERVAAQIFCPLTVGGGIRREDDVRRLLNAGADKVAINSAAVSNPPLVGRLTEKYGSQCIVGAVDVRRLPKPRLPPVAGETQGAGAPSVPGGHGGWPGMLSTATSAVTTAVAAVETPTASPATEAGLRPWFEGPRASERSDSGEISETPPDSKDAAPASTERGVTPVETVGIVGSGDPVHGEDAPLYEVVIHGGSRSTGLEAVHWCQQLAALGAGELLVTSMDRDGTRDGYDLYITRMISRAVPIPVIASGGVGTLAHLREGLADGAGEADAALAASIFHFGLFTIAQAKHYLMEHHIPIRSPEEILPGPS